MNMNIGWHVNELNFRGTTCAAFDYAFYNQTLLGNKSVIISDLKHPDLQRRKDFEDNFTTELYSNFSEDVPKFVDKHNLDAIFYIKHGANDGKVVKNTKNWVQAVFRVNEPHGDAYFYNSHWLADYMGGKPWLPHIVNKFPQINEDYREFLGIPRGALVFGFHGGKDSFNIPFVQKAVETIAQQDCGIYFVFMNIDRFSSAKNIFHLAATSELEKKLAFINTCTAMLHAREQGETFGLSIAEFSACNKPVITYADSPERNHISVLREDGFYYRNYDQIYHILKNFHLYYDRSKNYDKYTSYYSPQNVMSVFDQLLVETIRPESEKKYKKEGTN